MKLMKLLLKFINSNKVVVSEEDRKRFIDSFDEPKNDYERVYFNYLCSIQNDKRFRVAVTNFICTLAIPFFMIIYTLNRFLVDKKNKKEAIIINNANRAGMQYNYAGKVPLSLFREYRNLEEIKLNIFPKFFEGIMGKCPFLIWINFFNKHPFSGFINLRLLLNLMGYNRIIRIYDPKAIVIARAEVNGCSSLITHLCELNNIEYINFMHGEVMTDYKCAFVRFSRFYIWDNYYREIFNWARMLDKQFIVEIPEMYIKKIPDNIVPNYYLLYVLTGDEKTGVDKNLQEILNVLSILTSKGKKCKIRPHPRWSNYEKTVEIFNNTNIIVEDPRKISCSDSILDCEYVAGTFSSVLTEAYYYNKPIILDDITDKAAFEYMQQNKYFLLTKEHLNFSDFLQKVVE